MRHGPRCGSLVTSGPAEGALGSRNPAGEASHAQPQTISPNIGLSHRVVALISIGPRTLPPTVRLFASRKPGRVPASPVQINGSTAARQPGRLSTKGHDRD